MNRTHVSANGIPNFCVLNSFWITVELMVQIHKLQSLRLWVNIFIVGFGAF